jgi:dTDP-4-dehydrorhamnose 3,5-epimerase
MQVEDAHRCKLIIPPGDWAMRGWFSETWNAEAMAAAGLPCEFCAKAITRCRLISSRAACYEPPRPGTEQKLVRVVRGAGATDVWLSMSGQDPSLQKHVAVN